MAPPTAATRWRRRRALPARVEKPGGYLWRKLESLKPKLPVVTGVRGKGLLLAVGLSSDLAEKVVLDCLANGLIVNNVRPNAVRLAPPLVVSEAECDEAVSILEGAISRAA